MPNTVRASEVSFNEAVLRLAAAHERAVEFRYAKTATSPIETRSFVPVAVNATQDGKTVFVGPDSDRNGALRSFRLDRIKGEVQIP